MFTKAQQQFITEVQTALMLDTLKKDSLKAQAVAAGEACDVKTRSTLQVLGIMDDAYYAVERLPGNAQGYNAAHIAACDFCDHFIHDDPTKVKAWFSR